MFRLTIDTACSGEVARRSARSVNTVFTREPAGLDPGVRILRQPLPLQEKQPADMEIVDLMARFQAKHLDIPPSQGHRSATHCIAAARTIASEFKPATGCRAASLRSA